MPANGRRAVEPRGDGVAAAWSPRAARFRAGWAAPAQNERNEPPYKLVCGRHDDGRTRISEISSHADHRSPAGEPRQRAREPTVQRQLRRGPPPQSEITGLHGEPGLVEALSTEIHRHGRECQICRKRGSSKSDGLGLGLWQPTRARCDRKDPEELAERAKDEVTAAASLQEARHARRDLFLLEKRRP